MGMSNYKLVCKLSVEHSYYKNNTCAGLQFIPAATTAAVLKQYRFKMVTKENGFQLYADTAFTAISILEYLQNIHGHTTFMFHIKNTAAEFINVTDWPLNWKGRFVFDNSSVLNAMSDKVVLLTPAFEQAISTEGILLLQLKNIVEMLKSGVADYAIYFTARATQWQYYVVNRRNVHFTNLVIKDKTGIRFSAPEEVIIPSGEKALFFSSNETLLPLSNVAAYCFDLLNENLTHTNGAAAKPIYKGLPNPDPLAMDTVIINGKEEASSPMYVYL